VTCEACPEMVLARKRPVYKIDLPRSSFSSHTYQETKPAVVAAVQSNTDLPTYLPPTEATILASGTISLHSEESKGLVNVVVGQDGEVDLVPTLPPSCKDRQTSQCEEIVAMDQCDDYPV